MPWQILLGAVMAVIASGCDAITAAAMRRESKAVAPEPIEIALADGRTVVIYPYAETLSKLSWSQQTLAEECRRSLLENLPAFGSLEVVKKGTSSKGYFPLDYFGKVSFKPAQAAPPPERWRLAQERAGVNLWVEAIIPAGGIRDHPPMKGGDMVEITLCGARLATNLTGIALPVCEDRIYHFDCEPTIFMNLLYPIERSLIVDRPLLWGFRFEPQRWQGRADNLERALKPVIVAWADACARVTAESSKAEEE